MLTKEFSQCPHRPRLMTAHPEARLKISRQKQPSDKAADTFRSVAGKAEDLTVRVAEQGREAGHPMQEVAGRMKGAVDTSIKQQPMATLAIAVVIGCGDRLARFGSTRTKDGASL
jgi:hypothetical protein